MTAHLLDNPVWAALTSIHRDLAMPLGAARRYPPEVAPFVGFSEANTAVEADDPVLVLGPQPASTRGVVKSEGVILQMICEGVQPVPEGPAIVALGEAERPAVLDLTARVYPHYFRPFTMRMGRYFGIFEGGRLAAMIGERLGAVGFREISAVCTDPGFLGRGLARRLLAFLGNDLFTRGVTPFLHVSPANERARALYLQNGYRIRYEVPFWSITPRD